LYRADARQFIIEKFEYSLAFFPFLFSKYLVHTA